MCSAEVKVKLFRAYCTPMYCCQLWSNYTKGAMRKLIVAYNNAFRILMRYSWGCSASTMFALHMLPSAQAVMRNLNYKFLKRVECSENSLVSAVNCSDLKWSSHIRKHWFKTLHSDFI